MRIATANSYDTALEQLFKRQSDLALQQEKLSTGLRVNRPSDDPTAAAQAERARVRLSRIEVDQRALEAQRSALATAETSLGEAVSLVQGVRELAISASNAAYSAKDRAAVAQHMADLRDQLLAVANRTDANAVPLFGGLGSSGAPFADLPSGVLYQASGGQRAATTTALPGAMDGQAIWMNVASGNGNFDVALGPGNTGTAWTNAGVVVSPAALTSDNYRISFTVLAGVTSYEVVDTTTLVTVATAQPYIEGAPIQFDGLSIEVRGKPGNGDAVDVTPSIQTNIFQVLDEAIAGIGNSSGSHLLTQAVTRALQQMDSSLDRLHAARSQAGDWLNRADSITSAQEKNTQALEGERSRAQDLDMAKGISDFNKFQTGYQAALQSYAQIQRLSLFNYIN